MNYEVFITSAVTGSGDTAGKSDKVPVTPKEIADAAIESAKAGAAIAHCHVRDPETGAPSRKVEYYREVVERIREADEDVVINLTAGMGGDLTLGNVEQPLPPSAEGTDMAGATERMEHVKELLPEICTLDCGTLNFGHGDYVMTNTPSMLRAMAQQMTDLGVRPEIEAFDTGHLWFAKQLVEEGIIEDPDGWIWSAFSIGRMQMPYVAAAAMAGGNIRVGLEDNLYLDRGVFATNGQLVERAVSIATNMGAKILGPDDVRAKLKLVKR